MTSGHRSDVPDIIDRNILAALVLVRDMPGRPKSSLYVSAKGMRVVDRMLELGLLEQVGGGVVLTEEGEEVGDRLMALAGIFGQEDDACDLARATARRYARRLKG